MANSRRVLPEGGQNKSILSAKTYRSKGNSMNFITVSDKSLLELHF